MKRDGEKARKFAAKRGQLARNTEAVRQFMDRGRKSGAESLQRSAREAARRPRPKEGPLSPEEWRLAAWKAADGRCMMSGARARDPFDENFDVHHPLPKRELRKRRLYDFVWDPRNALWLAHDVHMAHEYTPGARIPRDRLPVAVWEFCAELDRRDGTQWATSLVQRLHPYPAGGVQPAYPESEED